MTHPTKDEILARIDEMLPPGSPEEQAAHDAEVWFAAQADLRRQYERDSLAEQAWLGVAKSTLALPDQAELERRRTPDHQPCPAKCRRCSRCIHSLAYYARGGRDYLGVKAEQLLVEQQRRSA